MTKDMNEIISQIQDVVRTLEVEHDELMQGKTDEEKSKIKEKSSGYFKHVTALEKKIEIRDEQIKTLNNKNTEFLKAAQLEITKRDTAIEQLLHRLPKSESEILKQKFESSPQADKDSSWWGMLGALVSTNPFTSKSHPKPPEAYKLDMSGDGSSGTPEAGADLGSSSTDLTPVFSIKKSDIDIIPMTRDDLKKIEGNTFKGNSFKDQFSNILFNLKDENVLFLKNKYHIEKEDIGNIKIAIKKIGFLLSLLTNISVDDYQALRNMEDDFKILPDCETKTKRTKEAVAKGLSQMDSASRTGLMLHVLANLSGNSITKLKEDAGYYSLSVPPEIEDENVFTYFQEVEV